MLAILSLGLSILLSAPAPADDVPLPDAKPIPRVQVLPLPHDEASFVIDGREVTRYHFGPDGRRPFLYPVVGPAGRSLTRMGHPHDPVTHSHHNSVWVSHHDVNGESFWGDDGPARIKTCNMLAYEDSDAEASLLAENAWVGKGDKVLLVERRKVIVRPLEGRDWLLILEIELDARGGPVTVGKSPFGFVGVRMAKTIGVNDGGGLIRNSEGNVGEGGANSVFWKKARWVDYSGPIAPGVNEGITLFDHPANPRSPTAFHVRADGWMGTSLTIDDPLKIEPGRPLRLRYGLSVHAGVPKAGAIDARWKAFAGEEGKPR